MIQHINIQIGNRERTRLWYEQVLGAEIHTTDSTDPVRVPSVHFAVEIPDWDGMIAHLDALGVP